MISASIGFLAVVGALAICRWAFHVEADDRPVMDLLFRRIRSRSAHMNRSGVDGASAALYPPSLWTRCQNPECGKLARGAHSCAAPTPENVRVFKRA